MELNKDCIQILQYLVEKNDFVKISEIAKKYKVTNRAIRYKIDKIEQFLIKNNFGYLNRKYRKGIRVPKDENLKIYLNKFIGEYTPYKYVYSKEERHLHMLLKLLQCNTPIKMRFFEKKLCVSKNTLLKELDSIDEWLKKRNLTLVRKPKIGMIVEGSEIDKRNAVVKIISQSTSSEDLLNYVSRKSIQSKINNLQFDTLFSDIDIDFIDSLIRRAEIELKREFSDEAYGGLITHLSIMIKRVQLNKDIYLPNFNENIVKETKEYQVSRSIIENIERHYNIKIPECEISYIVIHLLGAKVLKNISKGQSKYNDSELKKVVNLMTEYVEMAYEIKFEKEKNGLIEGLILHLRPSIYRIKYGSSLINPLFHKIKTKYSELFKIVKAASKYLEEFIGSPLSEHEISYIVLHYGAALRLYEQRKSKKARVIIVCGTGIGTSKMIAASIFQKFQVEIIGTYASRNINKNILKTCDYIISTIDIPNLEKDDYIKISPLLSEKDFLILNKYLLSIVKKTNSSNEIEKTNKIINIIKKYGDIKDEEQLKYEIMYELKRKNEKFPEEKREISLSELLRKETIEVKLNCKDWEDVILNATRPLEKKNYITYKYTEEIIKNLKKLGPYMVIAPGVCLAHANLPEEINDTSMSFINLKYPIKFHSKFNDPVKIVLTFATKDKESHIYALSQFMDIINNSNELQKLMNASSKDEVLKIINKY
ncbi:transcription antiterminator [Clostridium niameyense]|uniref:Transcription antiterminator n=1 Tax=Clostridium niameyense TaxID=1622073 RepID=A0A6M0RBN4_9CLOT|nr:BglG family transcription antiterminator [Clostridium niameyense]NEZ47592.1 transcription antiterminator [Clostridium niameyense]